jgi:hypothetical protein
MMRRGYLVWGVGVLAVAATGCSLIGFGIGSAVDSAASKVPGWKVDAVRPGRKLALRLTDGTVIHGPFVGVERSFDEAYRERYEEARSVRGTQIPALPALGPATVIGTHGDATEVEIVGFDPDAVWLRRGAGEPYRQRLDTLSQIRNGDSAIKVASLRPVVGSGAVPAVSTVHVGESRVALERISGIRYQGQSGGKATGFVLGLVLDVLVVASLNSEPEPSDCDEQNSCPFVYSSDGRTLKKEAEVFGGAIFEKAQRADWVRLDHLQPSRGRYHLRFTNELRETQYIDEAALLVVDHAPGTRILPSGGGRIHAVRDEQPPVGATDLAGRPVRDLVAAADDRAWAGDPFRAAAAGPEADVRDGLVLDFTPPAGATSATLTLRLQNTLWASYLQGHILSLVGSGLPAWYGRLNASVTERERLHAAMVREGMLRVETWTGSAWRPAGHVWEVGPALMREQAAVVDLAGLPKETLRIRLSSTAGLWVIDRAAVAFDDASAVQVTELTPVRARDDRGRDVLGLLQHSDGNRLALARMTDYADLEFAAPTPRPGFARSTVVKAAGYYTIHTPPAAEPRPDLLEAFIDEPGAYGRFTLQMLDAHRRRIVASASVR